MHASMQRACTDAAKVVLADGRSAGDLDSGANGVNTVFASVRKA